MATYNRAPILKRSLDCILQQDGINDCELLIIDDGSSDATPTVLAEAAARAPGTIRVFQQANRGPARARNLGIQQARHDRLLFIDDDVFPRPGMLHSHRELLDAGFTGSQGLLVWHREIRKTELIDYMDSRGAQFDFDRVPNPDRLTFLHVYSGNLALDRRAVLDVGGFDEHFAFSAFEDTALAYKLLQKGARIALNREAIADHLHDVTEQQYLLREYKAGCAAGVLAERYPEIAAAIRVRSLGLLPGAQQSLLRLLLRQKGFTLLLNYHWRMRLQTREAFRRGMLEYQQSTGAYLKGSRPAADQRACSRSDSES